MSQATLLGLCSDNVVTILQPSSTIECPLGCGSYVDVSSNTGGFVGSTVVQIPITGSVFISGVVTATGPTTVTIGGVSTISSGLSIPFQTFAIGSNVILAVTGNGSGYSYTIARLQ